MKKINLTLAIGLCALASGCATKEQTTTYWTRKGDTVVVHHVRQTQTGAIDQTERLTDKAMTADEIQASKLTNPPAGHHYCQVTLLDEKIAAKPAAKSTPSPKKRDADNSKDKLADVTSQLHDLKGQVAAVAAQNKRLAEQIKSAPAPEPEPTPQQEADLSSPRMSQ